MAMFHKRPKEVQEALDTLDEACEKLRHPPHDGHALPCLYDEAFQMVREFIECMVLANEERFARAIAQEGVTVRQWVYGAIAKRAGDLVESGEFHFYRGALDPMRPGEDLLRLFDAASDELVKMGLVDSEFAEEQKAAIRNNIRTAG